MSKKHTTLHSVAITGCKSPSGTTSAIDVALNHNITTVGQPTRQTLNTFSIIDMTEKVIDLDIVDSTLLLSQRNTDNRLKMGDLGEAKTSPQQTMDNEEEIPFFTRYAHLVPTAKSPAPESEEDELSSSDEIVNKEFDKKEFLLGFQKNMATAMSAAMSEVMSKLLEQPTKDRREKQRRKNLREKEAKYLTDNT